MQAVLGRYRETCYALLRGAAGFLFLCHGLQKALGLLGGFHGTGAPAPALGLLWVAGWIELVGGALILVGLGTSWAAFVCSGEMAVAYFLVHQPQGLLPVVNGGERAALYAWIFLYIAARGSGSISLDAWRRRPVRAAGPEAQEPLR